MSAVAEFKNFDEWNYYILVQLSMNTVPDSMSEFCSFNITLIYQVILS